LKAHYKFVVVKQVTLGSAMGEISWTETLLHLNMKENYRYLVAIDMSWRAVDIATAYTLRVEVFFEDWKLRMGTVRPLMKRGQATA